MATGTGLDIFQKRVPDQYIDVTALPAGEYNLTAIADPDNWFAEQDDSNNRTTITITIPAEPPPAAVWQVFFCLLVVGSAGSQP